MRISRRTHRPRTPRRARLRTRVLAGVMSVTLAALVAFDIAAVSQMHRYLIIRADAQLRNILNLLEPLSQPLKPSIPARQSRRPQLGTAVSPIGEATAGTGRFPSRDPGDYHIWFMAGLGQTGYIGRQPGPGAARHLLSGISSASSPAIRAGPAQHWTPASRSG